MIERFKSIARVELPCRKVNVFIGEPDTGKTNILEALYFLSHLGWVLPIGNSLRLRQDVGLEALFYRQFINHTIHIALRFSSPSQSPELVTSVDLRNRNLHITLGPGNQVFREVEVPFNQQNHFPELMPIRYYVFGSSEQWGYGAGGPFGAQT